MLSKKRKCSQYAYTLNAGDKYKMLSSAKLKLKDKLIKAKQIQDDLREKSVDWNGEEMVRKMRNERCKF